MIEQASSDPSLGPLALAGKNQKPISSTGSSTIGVRAFSAAIA